MKSYFLRLLNYDHFANRKVIELIIQTAANGKPIEIMAHLLTAQQTWLKRLKTSPAPLSPLWPDWSIDEIKHIIESNYNSLFAYLENLQPQSFEQIIAYQNSAGEFQNTVADILAHLFNHGTHHRAQIGTLLKANGTEMPALDYILYIRNYHFEH